MFSKRKDTPPCMLCSSTSTHKFHQDKRREYYRCTDCDLIFVPEQQFLSPTEEKARYDLHENSPADKGYRNFLCRMFIALEPYLKPGSRGLDFGCGPAPTLSLIFEESGHSMEVYDHFYDRNMTVFDQEYDFITTTEVVEHLHHPLTELNKLWDCIKPGGYLGIMTNLHHEKLSFDKWYYKDDATHVCFFSRKTFEWIAKKWEAEVEFKDKDIVIFQKRP